MAATGAQATMEELLEAVFSVRSRAKIYKEERCRAPYGAHDQICIILWQLRSCFSGAPSLMRGQVCILYMLLVLASAVFLGSESLGSRDHILLSQFWAFPFRRLLLLAGSRWKYSTPPPHGSMKFISGCLPYNSSTRTTVENTISNSIYIIARGLLLREHLCLLSLLRNRSTRYNIIKHESYVVNTMQTNSVALICKRTTSAERPPLVCEVVANFCGYRVSRGQRKWSPRPYSRFSSSKPLLFLPSSTSVVLNEAEWTTFQTHYFSENLVAPGIEPGTSGSVARNSDH
jgi:hypothetical protein